MTVFVSPVPTAEQIPYLSSLGDDPSPRIVIRSKRWAQLTPTEQILMSLSEDAWTSWVLDAASLRGWRFWHDRDSRLNARGFPDLLLLRDRSVWAELKSETGLVRPGQVEFAADLTRAGQPWHLWRPRHKATVLEVLR
jgi:hypothetical protein